MLLRFLLMLCILNCLWNPSEAQEHKTSPKVVEVVKKFLQFVMLHNLNVSVVFSDVKHWTWTNRIKSIDDFAIFLPPNSKQLLKSKLSPRIQQQWVEIVQELQVPEVLSAHYRKHVIGNEITNNTKSPDTPSYRWIVNYVKNKQQFEINDTFTLQEYNFRVKEADGREFRAQVVTSNVTICEKSVGLNVSEKTKMKQSVLKAYTAYNDFVSMAKGLSKILGKEIPNNDWHVLVNVCDTVLDEKLKKKYAVFLIRDEIKVVVFAGKV